MDKRLTYPPLVVGSIPIVLCTKCKEWFYVTDEILGRWRAKLGDVSEEDAEFVCEVEVPGLCCADPSAGEARKCTYCPKQLWVSKARMTQQEGFKCYQIYGLACDDDVEAESADDDDEVEDAPQEDDELFELFGEE